MGVVLLWITWEFFFDMIGDQLVDLGDRMKVHLKWREKNNKNTRKNIERNLDLRKSKTSMNHIKYTFLFRNIEMFCLHTICNDILSIFNGLFGLFFFPLGCSVVVPFVLLILTLTCFCCCFFAALQYSNNMIKNGDLCVCVCFTNHWSIYRTHACTSWSNRNSMWQHQEEKNCMKTWYFCVLLNRNQHWVKPRK